jgi:hypothetical protein
LFLENGRVITQKKNQKEQTFKKGRRSIQRKTGKERM